MKRILIASSLLALTSLASGCGLKGPLERPAPMWGSERERYLEQQKQAEAQAAAANEAKTAARPRVDIPVDGGSTSAQSNTQSAAPAVSAADATSSDETTPDLKQSGGAVPPVDNISRQRSGY